jgi:hypothetical protein
MHPGRYVADKLLESASVEELLALLESSAQPR